MPFQEKERISNILAKANTNNSLPPAKAGVNWFGVNWSWLVDIETIDLEINDLEKLILK